VLNIQGLISEQKCFELTVESVIVQQTVTQTVCEGVRGQQHWVSSSTGSAAALGQQQHWVSSSTGSAAALGQQHWVSSSTGSAAALGQQQHWGTGSAAEKARQLSVCRPIVVWNDD